MEKKWLERTVFTIKEEQSFERSSKCCFKEIDISNKTGIFQGGSEYITSLDGCSCPDYRNSFPKLPCKHTVFRFNTYPSREAKMMDLHPMQGLATIGFGGSGGGVYSPVLHTWEALARTSDIFPDGIPVEEARQKERLYAWVKEYLALTDYEDVFEMEEGV